MVGQDHPYDLLSSDHKAVGVVVHLSSEPYCLFLKGALEILMECTCHIVISKNPDQSQYPNSEIGTKAIDEISKHNIPRTIIFYTNQMLRTIALCYQDFELWPPAGTNFQSANEIPYEELSCEMTLVAITGIEDPLCPGIYKAVIECHKTGIMIKVCTRGNVLTAHSITTQCSIYTAGGTIMEGPFFCTLNDHEQIKVVPHHQVLAQSFPKDKKDPCQDPPQAW